MQIRGHDIAVCSWSLQPSDTADLIARVKQLGLEHVQLGLDSLLAKHGTDRGVAIDMLRKSGLTFTATSIMFPGEDYTSLASIRRTGGFVPNEPFEARKEIAMTASRLTAELGLKYLECHVGFVPSSSDPAYNVIAERVREIANALAGDGVDLLIETGQESASELLQFLNDLNCRNVAANFDPANMILYGAEDPIDAITILNRHIKHVHVKDAVSSSQPRMQWGQEVPFGSGEVIPQLFLDALDDIGYTGPLAIEREDGHDRMGDIRHAIELLRELE